MPTPLELQVKFWAALKNDMTMMLGAKGTTDGHPRPMTAQFENDQGPLWFFTTKDNSLVIGLSESAEAVATFTSKDHDLFATVDGALALEPDQAVVDRFWNRFVAAWYEGGKDDPNLALLRFEPKHAEIWEDATSLWAGAKLLLGIDPKSDYKDKVAHVDLT